MSEQRSIRKQGKRREQHRTPFTVKDYHNELVFYGGEWMPRGDVIHDLDSRGFTQQERDLVLFGLDRHLRQITSPQPADPAEWEATGTGSPPERKGEAHEQEKLSVDREATGAG